MIKKILIVDNSIHKKCDRCSQFHRHFNRKTSVLHSADKALPKNVEAYSHIILTGSADSVDELSRVYARLRPFILRVKKAGIPMLGICYGFQAIAAALSDVENIDHYQHPEIGWTKIYVTKQSILFKDVPKSFYAIENHTSSVRRLPSELIQTAESQRKYIQAFEHESKPIYGVQFHPEATSYGGLQIVALRLKHRAPLSWFTGTTKPASYKPEIPEKIIFNFYNSAEQ
ncbi:MAG: gamma-glutamyl-gamma-aminobutyrate hydrolase family protein [bacterium]